MAAINGDKKKNSSDVKLEGEETHDTKNLRHTKIGESHTLIHKFPFPQCPYFP